MANANNLQIANEYYDNGDYHKSVYYYMKYSSSNPGSDEAKIGVARSNIKLHKYQKALLQLDELIEINPYNFDALFLRADILSIQKLWSRLLLDAEALIQIKPLDKSGYMYLDMAYVGLGDEQSAKAAIERYELISGQAK
ncbi:MAG TPA: hypothetical protein VIQ81_05255 [Gammaproteobacteria bacterium]